MKLRTLKSAMRRDVCSEAHRGRFARAQTRHPALAEHETVSSILAALKDESRERHHHREAIARALIYERQERPHPFWSAVLLVAYFPMLSRLRGRLCADALGSDDLDQLVITSFLDTIHEFPLDRGGNWISARLRQMTQRRVFRSLRHEQQMLEQVCPTEPALLLLCEEELLDRQEHATWPEMRPPVKRPLEPKECQELIAFLVEQVGDAIRPDKLEPVIATLIRGERLRTYVERLYPGLAPGERQRAYQRVKRRHSRLIAQLRDVLAPLDCPRNDPPGLCLNEASMCLQTTTHHP
ncbi:MAG: hypothetical protein MJE77_36010 [Proteobacteria bacterium]|nr:hypothetical protein [Pseudomonadota bacterium]